jgi:hypothetical protein
MSADQSSDCGGFATAVDTRSVSVALIYSHLHCLMSSRPVISPFALFPCQSRCLPESSTLRSIHEKQKTSSFGPSVYYFKITKCILCSIKKVSVESLGWRQFTVSAMHGGGCTLPNCRKARGDEDDQLCHNHQQELSSEPDSEEC